MINGKKKGNAYELDVARKFREKGWVDCVSSRSESKRLDDAGVDLCYTHPFQVQCKAVEKLGLAHNILKRMPEGGSNVIFHKVNHKGTAVYMTEELFWDLLEKAGYTKKLDFS